MIQRLALGAQRSNMMTVPTDCDQRDERLGWMGDENLSSESMALNYNAGAFLRNFVDAMVSEQGADGSLPDTVPFARYGGRPADVSWSTALPQTVHVLHANGDIATDELTQYMPALLAQLDNVKGQARNGVAKMHTPYGDWCPPPAQMGRGQGPKPSNPYTSAFSYINMIHQIHDLAVATGNSTLAVSLGMGTRA